MPKRPFPPPARRKKTPKAPETVDEYLAVAVELEESGERWRSGDVSKAGRFFVQAITAYETTLARYPDSFDARYNRARLLYTLTQLPLPSSFFPPGSTAEDRLLAAVAAHKECNELERDSSDVLFNYGQTLSSLGEFYAHKEAADGDDGGSELKRLLPAKEAFEAAWQILQQCLAIQEREYKATLAQTAAFENDGDGDDVLMDADDGGVRLRPSRRSSAASSQSSGSGNGNTTQWAAIVEPTTTDTLLDTTLAMLDVHTSILGLGGAASASTLFTEAYLHTLTATADDTLANYILPLAGALHREVDIDATVLAEREMEAALARANYLTALAELRYHLALTTPDDWETVIASAFHPVTLPVPDNTATTQRTIDLSTSWMGLCDRSTAYTALATAIASSQPTQAWRLGSAAARDLKAATDLSPEKSRAEVYLARANLELLRAQIPVAGVDAASRALLRKNASVYCRNAVAASSSGLIGAVEGGKVKEVVEEARIKEALIRWEDGNAEGIQSLIQSGIAADRIRAVLRAAVEEGLFSRDLLNQPL
ncbi:hypothetical protein Dda_3594 [Drechslerella dactyloides]|uniref:Uncharacterized protein n=1 Tax=Drechslerella dactyloides TaxID=74499 RepID=A0AAD6NLA2_DREDA|nr:hypothetical protein Dda_3594 [Drechslerella dactyloides]